MHHTMGTLLGALLGVQQGRHTRRMAAYGRVLRRVACAHACMGAVEHTIATCIWYTSCSETFYIQQSIQHTQCPDNVLCSRHRSCIGAVAQYADTLSRVLLRLTPKFGQRDGRPELERLDDFERLRQRLRPLVPDAVACRACARAGQA